MVNVNPNRESCMEYMKELIRKKLSKTEVIEECKKGFDNVHPSTFYDWYDIVIVESDIEDYKYCPSYQFFSHCLKVPQYKVHK